MVLTDAMAFLDTYNQPSSRPIKRLPVSGKGLPLPPHDPNDFPEAEPWPPAAERAWWSRPGAVSGVRGKDPAGG